MTDTSKPIDFKILDGLRGIAALYVLMNHCRGNLFIGGKALLQQLPFEQWTWMQKAGFAALRLTSLSREFVILFFVLSGFSIAHSLRNSPAIWGYLKRRFFRIYPVFFAALVWAFLVYQCINRVPGILPADSVSVAATPEILIKNLLFIPKGALTAQFWSLSQEVLFYTIAPFVLVYLPWRNGYFFLSLVGYVAGLFCSTPESLEWGILFRFVTEFNAYFACGVFLYRFYPHISNIVKCKKPSWMYCILVCYLGILVVMNYYWGDANRVSGVLAAVGSVVVIVNFLHFGITNRLFRLLGNMSYTLYITHYATVFLVLFGFIQCGITDRAATSDWYVWMIAVPLVVMLTFPLYWLVERPCKNYLQQLRNSY